MERLHNDNLGGKTTTAAAQKFLEIAEIKEDVVMLKNGSIRAVLEVSSINFDLKSTAEQEAIIVQYQNFLNSVDFPIQILITSRKLNIESYLEFLNDKERHQTNELLRLQLSEYREFIRNLVNASNIMDKSFYIIIPFSPIENQQQGFFSNLFNMMNPKKNIIEKRESFDTYKNQLYQRVDHVIAALSGIGLRIVPLKTQELIELFFYAYNPSVYNSTSIEDISKLEIK